VKLAKQNVNQKGETPSELPMGEMLKNALEAYEQAKTKITQLHSLLAMITGEGLETFDAMDLSIKGDYLWACGDLTKDCDGYLEDIGTLLIQSGQALKEANHVK
jgi:hypothetical protein